MPCFSTYFSLLSLYNCDTAANNCHSAVAFDKETYIEMSYYIVSILRIPGIPISVHILIKNRALFQTILITLRVGMLLTL